jgi:hypothetical protein
MQYRFQTATLAILALASLTGALAHADGPDKKEYGDVPANFPLSWACASAPIVLARAATSRCWRPSAATRTTCTTTAAS